jgi:hypothetical protein
MKVIPLLFKVLLTNQPSYACSRLLVAYSVGASLRSAFIAAQGFFLFNLFIRYSASLRSAFNASHT